MTRTSILAICLTVFVVSATVPSWPSSDLHLTQHDVLETRGLSILLFHNSYHRVFGDQKMSGLEIVLHEQRIATGGDVRLSATPAQWDPIPDFKERKRGSAPNELTAFCTYEEHGLSYRIDLRPEADGFRVAVQLDEPIPVALAGKAGFNLEFMPTSYFGKSYVFDDAVGIFPRHSDGPMEKTADGNVEPLPLAMGRRVVLSPEDPSTRVTINSDMGPVMLFDGRNKAQNGWFVLRSVIPAGQTGDVVVWHVRPNVLPGWTRPPVIGYNQVGYTPERQKVAVVELDPSYDAPKSARVCALSENHAGDAVVSEEDFAVIGSGCNPARTMLFYREQDNGSELMETIYAVIEAKEMAGTVPGVGPSLSLEVMYPDNKMLALSPVGYRRCIQLFRQLGPKGMYGRGRKKRFKFKADYLEPLGESKPSPPSPVPSDLS
jgi:hypothetical protein